MDNRRHVWKNIGFASAALFLWTAARVFHVRVMHGQAEGFRSADLLFIFLPPVGAFFLNWHWMREQRTDTIIKWALSWAAIDLAACMLAVFLLGAPLHAFIQALSQ